MPKTYLLLLSAILSSTLTAQNQKKSAHIPSLYDEGMVVDGVLSEVQWNKAAQLAQLECYFP